jgi:D-glycero-D-manno-heptose 1,7-bisphosphate phosphatase
MSSLDRAVFLDRDGVINEKALEGAYITDLSDFRILPGVLGAIARLNQNNFRTFVITNQRGIARGLVAPGSVTTMHDHLLDAVSRSGGRIEKIYVCPHDYSDDCACRKPKPGMLLAAAREFGLDLTKSWMIGDSAIDVEAGRRAGCRTAYVGEDQCQSAHLNGRTLEEVVVQLLAVERQKV